jgi:hypothetical protein
MGCDPRDSASRDRRGANRLHPQMEAAVALVLIPGSTARAGCILAKRTQVAEMPQLQKRRPSIAVHATGSC